MGKRTHEVLVTLRRDSTSVPWGFSLVGGADVNAPLIVTRVAFGSPSDGVLQRGDIITKVGNYDSRDIRHQDAQNLFRNTGNEIRVVVQRDASNRHNTSTASSRASYSPLSVSPHLSPRGGNFASPSSYSPGAPALAPYYSLPFTPLDDNYFQVQEVIGGGGRPYNQKGDEQEIHVNNQPYRTTPLVLPGAKVKREPGPTESYLRHHPNPAVRAPPHHLDNDYLLKQKVANTVLERISTGDPNKQLVHKQFNSPINLYSEANIQDTVQKQTGISPVRKSVKYNPAESETYKALQEEHQVDTAQEVSVAPQGKVFAPNKSIPGKKPQAPVNQNPGYGNSLGDNDVIHQSHSFKRLMWSVMNEN